MDYYEQFRRMIDEYNRGAISADAFFAKLVSFAQELTQEERRGIAESLSEEELAIFDLLTRPDIKLSKSERKQVKNVAQELLRTLKVEKLVLDWRKKQQTRAAVLLAIEQVLDKLPDTYSPDIYQQKCGIVYRHIYDAYFGMEKSIYGLAG
jgi:type I restriction enzyme R subunit